MGFRCHADTNRDADFRFDPVMEHPKAREKMPKLSAVAGGADCGYFKPARMRANIFDVQ